MHITYTILANYSVFARTKRRDNDLRKLGVKRWRTKALDRVEWASIIREAKAKLKGP
jgi:hypothetical protein